MTLPAFRHGAALIVEYPFAGNALCAVDSAGCVHLPLFALATIARRSDAHMLLVGPHEIDPCLIAYEPAYIRLLYADHERRRVAREEDMEQYSRARRIFGSVAEAGFGAEGAIALSPMIRDRGGIEALALFVGAGGTLEIWNPQTALDYGQEALQAIAAWELDHYSSGTVGD